MEPKEKSISAQLGRIHHVVMRNMESRLSLDSNYAITPPQVRTILFIAHQPAGTLICQRNLEEVFDLQPPSVSLLLRNMEKSGFIYRQSVEGDGRLKSVHLTPSAQELSYQLQRAFDQIEEIISQDITQEEREVFFSVLNKIRKNLE